MGLGLGYRSAYLLIYPAVSGVNILAEGGAMAISDMAAAVTAEDPDLDAVGVDRVNPGPHAQSRNGACDET
jgi:hypothetical protein